MVVHDGEGNDLQVPRVVPGAEGQYEDWVYLRMLEWEWLKPVEADFYESIPERSRPSARAIVVLVFWSYFETRIERLYRETALGVPKPVMAHLLERHPTAGRRMKDLYRLVFSTTYLAELNQLGYGSVAELLRRVQKARNSFTHGHPEAINDALVEDLVAGLEEEHEAWVAVFNRRIKTARNQTGNP